MKENTEFEVKLWLEGFARCVRECNFSDAEAMFCPDATGFGTWTKKMNGLDELRKMQWENVWTSTQDFEFDIEDCSILFSGNEGLRRCVVTATWRSVGLSLGKQHPRDGCVTIVLEKRASKWVAIHSHFSQSPKGVL